jgi:dihydrofolate reductase
VSEVDGMVSLVVAYARNRVIGRDGDLPWHLPADLAHFKQLTLGGTVVMGRKTYESIPDRFRPLPGRRNLVLSRTPELALEGAEVFGALGAALEACGHDCFVVGGAETYAEVLPAASRVVATEVDADVEGDTYFPELDAAEWALVDEGERVDDGELAFTIRVYERREA